MDEFDLFDKRVSQAPPRTDMAQLTNMLEVFQNSLHQQKMHIACEVRTIVFQDVSNILQQQISVGLEDLNKSYKSSLESLEHKVEERFKKIEERITKLECENWHSSQSQMKIIEDIKKHDDKIQDLFMNSSTMAQMIWKSSENHTKLEEMQQKLSENILEIYKDVKSVSELVKFTSERPNEISDILIRIQELSSEMNRRFNNEKLKTSEKIGELGSEMDDIKLKVSNIEMKHNKVDNLPQLMSSMSVKNNSELEDIWKSHHDGTIRKFNSDLTNLDLRVALLEAMEEKNMKVRQKVGV